MHESEDTRVYGLQWQYSQIGNSTTMTLFREADEADAPQMRRFRLKMRRIGAHGETMACFMRRMRRIFAITICCLTRTLGNVCLNARSSVLFYLQLYTTAAQCSPNRNSDRSRRGAAQLAPASSPQPADWFPDGEPLGQR